MRISIPIKNDTAAQDKNTELVLELNGVHEVKFWLTDGRIFYIHLDDLILVVEAMDKQRRIRY